MTVRVLEAVFATSHGVDRKQLAMDDTTGVIVEFGALGVPAEKLDWRFGDECLAFAGMGDIHIHAREDVSGKHTYKEDFVSASAAALNGGVTHVADMPNNPIPPIDGPSYLAKLALTQKAAVPILLYAGIGPATNPLPFLVPYKAYMGPSVGELFFTNNEVLETAIARYQGQWVSFHCEDPVLLEAHKSQAHHHLKRPVECEVIATRTALALIEKYHLQGKLCHYSAGEGLPLILAAKKRGVSVSCEVTPQHLFFSQDELQDFERGQFQMNPPIRGTQDRDAMLESARRGEIDFLATDHAPHSAEEKLKGTSGLTGLDSYGSFVTWLLREKNFTPERVALMCAENPGAFSNQFLPVLAAHSPAHRKLGLGVGFLRKGFAANVTVLDLESPSTLTARELKTRVGHNPFVGVTFPGRVAQVFLGGRGLK